MKHLICVNGLDHAFLREFGCDCARCQWQRRTANTSVSLITLSDNGQTLHHVLFDVGMGVVDSLVDSPYLSGNKTRLDWLIISHWHPDHVLDLNRLCETWRRTLKRRGEQWKPIPTWCRNGTAEWLKRNHAFEWNSFLKPQLSGETSPPGVKLAPIQQLGIAGVIVTPITVSHCTADIGPANPKERLYCSTSFVIEYEATKVVLLWDIDNRNDWIDNPTSDEQKEAFTMLSGADYLFIDCNTWSVEEPNGKNTGHASFLTVHRYAKALSPRTTFLVHLSGHEDGEGNPGWDWNDSIWEQKAQGVWTSNSLPGRVYVPNIGTKVQI